LRVISPASNVAEKDRMAITRTNEMRKDLCM
jgi:hypothetical protein